MKDGYLRFELKRGFQSEGFKLALLFGLLAMVPHLYVVIQVYFQTAPFGTEYQGFLIGNAFGNSFSMYSTFSSTEQYYYFCLPLLAVLPHGGSFYQDIHMGYARNILTRVDKERYLKSKYCATFLSGGCAILIPIIVDFLVTMMFFPLSTPIFRDTLPVIGDGLLVNIYFKYPFIYLVCFWMILFGFSGLVATISLLITYITDFVFAIMAMPFVFFLGFYVFADAFHIQQWNPLVFVQAMQTISDVSLMPIVVWLGGLVGIGYPLFIWLGKRRLVW